jgi:hypothetical protein
LKISLTKLLGVSVIFLFYLIPLQDLLASYFFGIGVPTDLVKVFLLLKEIIIVLWGLVFLFRRQVSPFRVSVLLFTLYSSVFVAVSELPLYYTLIGFRTYVLILFAFIVGEHLGSTPEFIDKFFRHVKIIFSGLLIFSILEYFILPTSIWKNLFPVLAMKENVLGLTLPEYYQTGLPNNIMGEVTRRMIGPFNEPLNMGYFTLILLNFFVARMFFTKLRSKTYITLGSIVLFLTQTRAVIIGYIISLFAVIFKNNKFKLRYLVWIPTTIVIGLFIVLQFQSWFLAFWNSIFTTGGRNVGHLAAYLDGLSRLIQQPFGHGIGVSSNSVGFATTNVSTENSFINIGIETGVIGLIWFLRTLIWLLIYFRSYLNRESQEAHGFRIVSISYLLLIQFIFAGFVAPHIMTARILIPFMVIIGWGSSIAVKSKPKTEQANVGNS